MFKTVCFFVLWHASVSVSLCVYLSGSELVMLATKNSDLLLDNIAGWGIEQTVGPKSICLGAGRLLIALCCLLLMLVSMPLNTWKPLLF